MPLTKHGKRMLRRLKKTYHSTAKAKQVLYATANAGKIKGIHKKKKK